MNLQEKYHNGIEPNRVYVAVVFVGYRGTFIQNRSGYELHQLGVTAHKIDGTSHSSLVYKTHLALYESPSYLMAEWLRWWPLCCVVCWVWGLFPG